MIACVTVDVDPPAGSGLQPGTSFADSVMIGPPGIGLDSVRIDVTLTQR
jgi:hypothetical protein